MNRFFETYELVLLLARELSMPGVDDIDLRKWGYRKDLVRLASTCQAVLDPVLDILWKELGNFRPILSLFPVNPASSTALVRHHLQSDKSESKI
jgi:hypothetical protein